MSPHASVQATNQSQRQWARPVVVGLYAEHYNTVRLMTTKIISQYRLLTSTEEGKNATALSNNVHDSRKNVINYYLGLPYCLSRKREHFFAYL